MVTKSRKTPENAAPAKDPQAPQHWRDAGSRDERGRLIREALFKAAAEIVGNIGYQNTSITMITQRAKVAQGTFYNHFASRQDILDQLLPSLGNDMLSHVRECSQKGVTLLEQEELRFRGFFSFLKETPHFFRILNEAESFAPQAYRTHLDLVSEGYVRVLKRAAARGEIKDFKGRELEAIAFILMAARAYLSWRYVYGEEIHEEVPEWVVSTYVKLVASWLSSEKPQG